MAHLERTGSLQWQIPRPPTICPRFKSKAIGRTVFYAQSTAISPQKCQDWRAQLETIEGDWLDNGLPRALHVYKRVNAHVVMPLAYEIAAHSATLDVVEGILGPDILLYSTEFLIKEPHTKHVVTMHQDLAYWGLGEIDGYSPLGWRSRPQRRKADVWIL